MCVFLSFYNFYLVMQSISSDIIDQTQRSNEEILTNQPLPNSITIATQSIQNSYQYPMTCASTSEDSNIMSVAVVRNPQDNYYAYTGNILDIYDYRIWSIFNMFFCSPGIGLYAVFMSFETRRKKRCGDHFGARNISNITAILNIVSTLSGILFYVIGGLRLSGYLIIYRPAL
ncbi:hypothetical protein I4U23_005960 [Adineta vaga]|nr:hypothetical protein I4U23_005960 [Adineta vaga]